MLVTIKSSEIKQGAKGDYLYINYIDHKNNEEHNKAIFSTLRDKWTLVEDGAILELKQDARYTVTDILPAVKSAVSPNAKTPPDSETSPQAPQATYSPPNRERSIERQQSLIQAVNWAVAQLQAGNKTVDSKGILKVAEEFDKYLKGS